ncbi:MAG TPA: hypothetical protein VJ915_04990 [Balneolaceae bacterium]|nr:hypothetical protein [Balneolaceae bacterium]
MKTILIILLTLFSATAVYAQTNVQSIESLEDATVSISDIDEQYGDALNADPQLALFNGRESDFVSSYRQLISDISSQLNSNGFVFDGDTRMFTRIYFNSDGTIDHFYYSSDQAGFSTEQEQQFDQILTPFLNDYSFSQMADKPFAQCSPVVYSSAK